MIVFATQPQSMNAQEVPPSHERAGDTRTARHPIPTADWWTAADQLTAHRSLLGLRLSQQPGAAGFAYDDASIPAVELRNVLGRAGNGCRFPPGFVGLGEGPQASLQSVSDLVADSSAIALGTVSGLQGGIHEIGGPGLLIQVEVRRWLKAPSGMRLPVITHFYYPRGDFRVEDALICAQARGFPHPPAVDAEILLFAKWLDADYAFLPVPPWRVAFETSGDLRAPDRLRKIPELRVLRFGDLMAFVRDAIGAGGVQR